MTDGEFRKTWLPLGAPLYRLAYSLLEDEAEAKDAVQDLFVKLLDSGSRLDSVRNPKAYAVTLMRNLCIDRIRAAKKWQAERCGPDEVKAAFLPAESDAANSREKLRRVLAIIGGLPPRQREVVRMRIFEDRSYEEISAATGLSENNLRVLLSMARKNIRKKYEED